MSLKHYRVKVPPKARTQREIQSPYTIVDLSKMADLVQKIVGLKDRHERDIADTEIKLKNSERQITVLNTKITNANARIAGVVEDMTETHREMVKWKESQKPIKGDPGYTPRKGVDYFDGKNGIDADEIGIFNRLSEKLTTAVTTLETTITEKLLAIITEKLEEIKKEIHTYIDRVVTSRVRAGGSGGGGMGTIKYFKFSGDDLTTTFTLPDFPTQDGNATFPRYQGQSLYLGDHFSVSGKTMTTTFVAETGTFIDGFIIT